LETVDDVQKWLKNVYKDPIANVLLENSNFTKIQLETFLIDFLSNSTQQKKINFENKAYLRLKGKVSRGSFNRSLKQCKNNIIRSIYTLLLLGYLGIFDSPSLSPYIELSNKLSSYVEAWADAKSLKEEGLRAVEVIRKELEKALLSHATLRKTDDL